MMKNKVEEEIGGMEIVNRVAKMKAVAKKAMQEDKKLGFIPTMGAIHPGHLSLVRQAQEMSDLRVVSIFVNPLQFGKNEDYGRYPRDLTRDVDLLTPERIDYLFTPTVDEMYPEGFSTYVEVEGLSNKLCGASRPGHFRGVATVVLKLFNIVQPTFAFFGQKDALQSILIKRMVKDLDRDTEIIVCPIVREEDGLAYSSRNTYLNTEERKAATVLYRALQEAEMMIAEGERSSRKIIQSVAKKITAEPRARIDYISVTDTAELTPLKQIKGEALIAVAVFIGNTRLIDNIIVNVEE